MLTVSSTVPTRRRPRPRRRPRRWARTPTPSRGRYRARRHRGRGMRPSPLRARRGALDAVVDGVQHPGSEVHGEGFARVVHGTARADARGLLVHLDGCDVVFDFDDLAHQTLVAHVDDVVHLGVEARGGHDRTTHALDFAGVSDYFCLAHSFSLSPSSSAIRSIPMARLIWSRSPPPPAAPPPIVTNVGSTLVSTLLTDLPREVVEVLVVHHGDANVFVAEDRLDCVVEASSLSSWGRSRTSGTPASRNPVVNSGLPMTAISWLIG